MKFRYNHGWKIDMRIDPAAAVSETNGYIALTNFGGTADLLEQGGTNIAITKDAYYTISLTFTNGELPKLTLTETGDAPVLEFDPAEYDWGIIGTATANNKDWLTDTDLIYKEDGSTHKWIGNFYLVDGEFKFRSELNNTWFGITNVTISGAAASTLTGTDNIIFAGTSTFYYVVLSTSDKGDSWTLDFSETSFGIIGDATPTGWDSDTDMTRAESGTSYSVTLDLTADQYKFRANDAWDYNLGGDAAGLTVDGDNLSVAEAGNYTITLESTDEGATFTSTAVKN